LMFIRIVEKIAAFDPTQILVGDVSALPIILYYGLAALSLFIFLKRHRLKRAISWGLCVLIPFLIFSSSQNIDSDKLIINFLDVGHGQAAVAQLPGGKNILFDAGSIYQADIGNQIVLPFLKNTGISRLDAVMLSHSDIDHINGLPEIAQAGVVRKVFGNVSFFSGKPAATVGTLKEALQENGLTIQPIGKDFQIETAAKVKILWPSDKISSDTNLGSNERSTVSLIEFGGKKVLLCSDIEKFSQEKLLETYPDLHPDILTVPHHGSTSTLSPDFIAKLKPKVLIYSCDKTIEEKHKADKPDNKKSFYTASEGAIRIEIDKEGNIKVDTFKHGRTY
jgi:competence protein ComEC